MGESNVAAGVASDRWVDRFLGRVPVEYREDFSNRKIETNLTRTLMLSVFIILVQVFLNVLNIIKPSTGESGGAEADIMKYVMLSLFTLSVGIIFLVVSLLMKKGYFTNKQFRKVMPFTLLFIYCAIQMIFVYFNVASEAEAGLNSYIIALVLVGFFIIMPPALNIASIVLLFSIALGILVYAQADGDLLKVILMGDSWANLLIITLLVMFMSYATYNMYRDNFLNSKRLEVSNERLDLLAKTDSLSGLYNRWGFYEIVDRDWGGIITSGNPVAVLMFDIDHFKNYNDTYGHLVGDAALKVTAQAIQQSVANQKDAMVCRFGGEEFLCLAQLRSEKQAVELAENIRAAVETAGERLARQEGYGPITVSGGFAVNPEGTLISFDELMNHADKALYLAKDGGRNRVYDYKDITAQ